MHLSQIGLTRHCSTKARKRLPPIHLCNSIIPQRESKDSEYSFPSSFNAKSILIPRSTQHFNSSTCTRRCYHATGKKEIFPLVGLGVGVFGYYSFRAYQRMNQELEEYEEALKKYKLDNGIVDQEINSPDESTESVNGKNCSIFEGGTVAIDLGTLNIRIAHLPSAGSSSLKNPSIVVNREGGRSTPNKIIFDSNGDFLTGEMALAKLYNQGGTSNPVLDPRVILSGKDISESNASTSKYHAINQVISSAAKNALDQIFGSNNSESSSEALFSVDTNVYSGFNVQPVFTYPPPPSNHKDTSYAYLNQYQKAISCLSTPSTIAKFIPEPVCAVAGAKFHNLLPNLQAGLVMVVDFGGKSSSISIVNDRTHDLLYHSLLEGLGGETMVEAFMNYLSKSFYGKQFLDLNDGMGMQRLYDASRSAIMEVGGSRTKNGRVQVNIPYLSVDEKMQPKHLDLGVSEKILEAEFTTIIASDVAPNIEEGVLSSFQVPKDLQSLMASAIMKALENSKKSPFELSAVLVVGGGARNRTFRNAMKTAMASLGGETFSDEKLVMPEGELLEELVVLGGATLGSKSNSL